MVEELVKDNEKRVSLKRKILTFFLLSGTALVFIVYITLYFISIEKSKQFNISKMDNFFNISQSSFNSKKEALDIIHNLLIYDEYIKEVIYAPLNGKAELFSGKAKDDDTLFKKEYLFLDSKVVLVYGKKAIEGYMNALIIRMIIVALAFYLLILVLYFKLDSMLNPFKDIIDYFQNFDGENLKNFELEKNNKTKDFISIEKSINKMIHNQKEYHSTILKIAHSDKLTKVGNRTAYFKAIESLKEENKRYSLLFIDLDGFKLINDTLGHSLGDKVLVEMTIRIGAVGFDVYRVGGDEFILLLADYSKEDIATICKKILQNIGEDFLIANQVINLSASIGISKINYDFSSDALKEADIAMYEAKEQGKNNYLFFENAMMEKIKNQLCLVREIREATKNREFTFFIQPQVHSLSGKIVGAEVLIRWNKDNKIVSPYFFIDTLESSSYIVKVGYDLIEDVFSYIVKNSIDIGGKISINISQKQIEESDFHLKVKAIQESTKCPISKIEFEITERWESIDNEIVIHNVQELYTMGYTFALDDFGEDNSSFKRTDILPIDKIKIDKSFTDRMFEEKSSIYSLEAIKVYVELTKKKLIIEGVETKEQVDKLLSIGIYVIQGYYYFKPLSKEAFLEEIDKRAKKGVTN